jgi:ATP-dependent Clp protease ATP-binding subunit ClpA
MFERFTERARQVVVLAQEEARGLKHNYIGTEHILLGLLREEEGLAARVLESLDITVERVRAEIVRIVGSGEEVTSGQIPFTPRAKKVLELTLREALILGHNYIGTEDILLGLVHEHGGVAARILLDFDADSEEIRSEVVRVLEAEDPDLELGSYLLEGRAEDRRKQAVERRAEDWRKQALERRNEDRLTHVWARRIGRSRSLADLGSDLERWSEDVLPERFRATGLLVLEAMKRALPDGEQDRALNEEEFTEAIYRLHLACACSLTYGTWRSTLSPRSPSREPSSETW